MKGVAMQSADSPDGKPAKAHSLKLRLLLYLYNH